MKKMLMLVVALVFVPVVYAGGAGAVIKGVAHAWDDIVRRGVKTCGREMPDDVAKASGKIVGKGAENTFRISGTQILAGGVSVAAVEGVHRLTAPSAAEADALRDQNEAAMDVVRKLPPEDQRRFAETKASQIGDSQKDRALTVRCAVVIVAALWGMAGLVFVLRKTSRERKDSRVTRGGAICYN